MNDTLEKEDLAIYGFGGFGREVACLINSINEVCPVWNLIGYFDDYSTGCENKYGKVLGGIDTLNTWDKPLNIIIAIASPDILKSVVNKIQNKNITFPNIFSPSVIYFDQESLNIGKGNIFCHGVSISTNVSYGDFNLMNCFTSFGHDVILGSYNSVGPGCRISGEVTIGDSNFIGVGATVLQRLKIGNHTRIGAASTLIRSAKDYGLYVGNPAQKMKFSD